MSFDTIFGLPVHALVVHAVVVFVPLAALGTIAVAAVPRWDRRYGLFVVAAALVAAGSAFVAKESGEALASRIGTPLEHFEIARWMPWFALALLVLVVALWWLDRARPGTTDTGPGRRPRRSTGTRVVAVLSVVAALAALVWVVRAGDSGARAVWGPIITNSAPGSLPVG